MCPFQTKTGLLKVLLLVLVTGRYNYGRQQAEGNSAARKFQISFDLCEYRVVKLRLPLGEETFIFSQSVTQAVQKYPLLYQETEPNHIQFKSDSKGAQGVNKHSTTLLHCGYAAPTFASS